MTFSVKQQTIHNFDISNPEQLRVKRAEAQEYKRRLAQGLGRPIDSYTKNNMRHILVGDRYLSSSNWHTFIDFLNDYIKLVLGREWGDAEIGKPDFKAHPLIIWYRKVCENQKQHYKEQLGTVKEMPMTGAVRAYYGLAYDLYLCAHNAKIQELLLQRLRAEGNFESAAYEISVVGVFIKAGYSIEFEDESDGSKKHCEFIATHQLTGRKFCVEAKAIQSTGSRSGLSSKPPNFTDRLSGALQKPAEFERIIFIDLSRAEVVTEGGPMPTWFSKVEADLARAETWTFGEEKDPAPPAYLFLTNAGYLHNLDSVDLAGPVFMSGFKIDDFPIGRKASRILNFVRSREKHQEIVWLHEAMQKQGTIPATFDGTTAEEAYGHELLNRPRIGDQIMFDVAEGKMEIGRLVDAHVNTFNQSIFAQLQMPDGTYKLGTFPLTKAEYTAYQRNPTTFFDIVKPPQTKIKTPLDCFDFVWGSYQDATKENLLNFYRAFTGRDADPALNQKELAELYCEEVATQMWIDYEKRKAVVPV